MKIIALRLDIFARRYYHALFGVLPIFANLLLHVHEVFLNFMPATSNTYTY